MQETDVPIILALAFSLCLLAAPAAADTRDERLDLARRYLDEVIRDLDMDRMIATMWQPVVQQLEAGGIVLTTPQRLRIEQVYLETLRAPMLELMRSQDELMADLMTLEEIRAISDFYATPEGRSVLTKLPMVLEAQQPQMMALLQNQVPALMGEVQRIVEQP